MAREPEPRVRARDFDQTPDHEAGSHQISNGAAAVLVLWAIVLDIADYFGAGEVLITDLLCVLTIDIYFIRKGYSPIRMFGAQALEAIPLVGDILPGYIAGVVFTLAQDRSELVAAAAKRMPQPKPGARIAGSAGQAANRIRMQAGKAIKTVETGVKKVQDAQKTLDRIPGPLRSVPGQADGSTGLRSNPARSGLPRVPSASSARSALGNETREGDLPFPDTYYRYERELLPELGDLTADIDVSGERAAQNAARRATGGPGASERVQ